MRQNVVIFIALFVALGLGLWGQYELTPERLGDDFPGVLYEVIMLFVLEGDWTRQPDLPWQLELARLLAPTAFITGILIMLTNSARIRLTNFFIKFWSGHVVVVGLGEKGWQFAQSCKAEHGVVVVERHQDNNLIDRARNEGILVVVGDFLDDNVMSAVNIRKAKHLVTFCGDDGVSVEIAIRTREYLRSIPERKRRRLRIHLHVSANEVSQRLENYSKFYDDHNVAEVDFFGVYDLTARLLLQKYPPDAYADVFSQRQVHIALYGFSELAGHILTEAVRICHFLNGSKVRFSILDKNARQKVQPLLNRHPGMSQLCDIGCIELSELHSLQPGDVSDEILQSVTSYVICLPNDGENLELTLMLRSFLLSRPGCNAPINVRMQHSSGLAKLLEAAADEPEIPDGIYPFGMLDEVLYFDNILTDKLDELAQALHEDYLARRQNLASDPRLYPSLNAWSDLPEPVRKRNRLQADHLAAKLRAVRCRYRPGPPGRFEFTQNEAEALARMEHARWRANNIFEGWREGAQRIEEAKVNPLNVPWQDIDETERQAQIDAILRLPRLLQSQLGWRIEREFYIGVTGHRPHRLDASDPKLLEEINRVLRELATKHADKRLIVVSPLAEGVDRVVARMAMDDYHMALHVPMPLPFELYQMDFEIKTSLDEFKQLIGRAEQYFELPTRFGSIEELASHVDGTPNEARNKQYALAGAYIAQVCDEVVAVYDGQPAQGTGGTAQVIQWRDEQDLPSEYRNESDFFFRPAMAEPIIVRKPSKSV